MLLNWGIAGSIALGTFVLGQSRKKFTTCLTKSGYKVSPITISLVTEIFLVIIFTIIYILYKLLNNRKQPRSCCKAKSPLDKKIYLFFGIYIFANVVVSLLYSYLYYIPRVKPKLVTIYKNCLTILLSYFTLKLVIEQPTNSERKRLSCSEIAPSGIAGIIMICTGLILLQKDSNK